MVVYKAFFKVIRKNLSQIIIYMVVFISLAVTLTNTNTNTVETNFKETKINIAFINNDEISWLIQGLEDYLGNNNKIVSIPDETKALQDALFFREVEYILKVPEGFTEGILKGETPQLEKMSIPQSSGSIYMDHLVNKYLDTVKIYIQNTEAIEGEQINSWVKRDLSENTEVIMSHPIEGRSNNLRRAMYFNYMSYSLFTALILGVCSVMLVFNRKDLKKRNLCAPLEMKHMNLQMILGHLTFAVLTWGVMLIPGIIMYGKFMLTFKGYLFMLNALVFTLAALSISYLISNLITNRNAMSAVANVVGLGTCFISGVFVPQELLGETVLKLASFTPNYWYVKSNHIIADLIYFDFNNLRPIFINMFIIIGFASAVLAVNLAIIKQKRINH
jgi:ABC-2 type transport system permease protein